MRTENTCCVKGKAACPFDGTCPKGFPAERQPSRGPRKQTVQVLMYHSICGDNEKVTCRYTVSKSTFRKHMEYLTLQGFCTPTIDSILCGATAHCTAGRRPIIVTFDDGYLDVYENAFPIFRELGIFPVIFFMADFSQTANTWDKDCDLSNRRLLRPDHIRSMLASGIQVGIHSFTHSSLPGLNDADLERELNMGKKALESITRHSPPMIAYPYGDIDKRVKDAVKRVGYRCAFSSYSGPLRIDSDLFEIRRIFMTNRTNRIYLRYKASGLDHILRWGIWRIKQLLGVTHGVTHRDHQDQRRCAEGPSLISS